jgi:integrase
MTVEVRRASIRLHFMLADGTRRKETLIVNGVPVAPSAAGQKHARAVLAKINREIRNGKFEYSEYFPYSKYQEVLQKGSCSLRELIDDHISASADLADATLAQYRSAARLWNTIMDTSKQIDEYSFVQLSDCIRKHSWRSEKHKKNSLIVLRAAFRRALDLGLIKSDPMARIKNPRLPKPKPDPLTLAERDKVLQYMRKNYDERIWAYFAFAMFTGVRPEEQIALRWSDIDPDGDAATISRVRTFRGGEYQRTKTGSSRRILVPAPAAEALTVMKRYTDGDPAHDIFQNPRTQSPWHDERAQRDTYWRPALKACGIRPRRAYATRHTFATAALLGGMSPAAIANQLGHVNAQMVYTTYTRWIDIGSVQHRRAQLEAALGLQQAPQISPAIPQTHE